MGAYLDHFNEYCYFTKYWITFSIMEKNHLAFFVGSMWDMNFGVNIIFIPFLLITRRYMKAKFEN